MIDIDANLFRAAAICQCDEETRYYLGGVFVRRHPQGGALLVATDGHRMFVAHDTSAKLKGTGAQIICIPRSALSQCAPKKNMPRRLIIDKNGIAQIPGVWQSAASCIIDGTFPDWKPCVPVQNWKNAPASFNGGYLASFVKIGAMLRGESARSIRVLTGNDDSSPALILFPGFDDAFGILMPMRAHVGNALPAWMKPVMDERKKSAVAKKQKGRSR